MKAIVTLLLALAATAALPAQSTAPDARAEEIRLLREQLKAISQRLDALEREAHTASPPPATAPVASTPSPAVPTPEPPPTLTADDSPTLGFFRGTTLNFSLDGYYGYNFNAPVGRVNLLRAYDVSSNSFSLNQATLMLEHLPTPAERFGGRIDLQYGQATETLQGSSANEQRPQVYRNLFQAYGSYLAPIGSGLTFDFGKFASALGNEGNYTKDQITYSRGYAFTYLPFYHMGLRAKYDLTPKVNFTYWLVNGVQQTEDFNGFKSQAYIFTLKPASTVIWNVNYYFGQEARDVQPTLNPGIPTSPTQPGLPTTNISPAPNGREHIFDTYATWTPTSKLTVVGEADFVVNRNLPQQQPARVALGAVQARYALPQNISIGGRFEYLDDRGGLFSNTTQALKEVTLVADRTFSAHVLARAEYRRDFSNQRFFLSDTPGSLLHAQTTATLGLVVWWGTKQGVW